MREWEVVKYSHINSYFLYSTIGCENKATWTVNFRAVHVALFTSLKGRIVQ